MQGMLWVGSNTTEVCCKEFQAQGRPGMQTKLEIGMFSVDNVEQRYVHSQGMRP